MVGVLYHLMVDVMGPLARRMTELPLADGLVAGPTFERVDLGPDPSATLASLAAGAIAADPAVMPIAAPLRDEAALAILT
jgi:hypothetical protein